MKKYDSVEVQPIKELSNKYVVSASLAFDYLDFETRMKVLSDINKLLDFIDNIVDGCSVDKISLLDHLYVRSDGYINLWIVYKQKDIISYLKDLEELS